MTWVQIIFLCATISFFLTGAFSFYKLIKSIKNLEKRNLRWAFFWGVSVIFGIVSLVGFLVLTFSI